ncbi:hypothetical protein GCM10010145_60240 [Streptomyces ruber]|uniref:Uncharacterized protein n=2 Tax=Streptomyces TaxID=1883 RepID=A0A918BPY5_9ACTN|nr:hypothetical protein GCM10010145_60240 [Streptomyces ruber]
MGDIGNLSPTGDAAVSIAGLWGEDMPFPEPGGRAAARLVPLTPSDRRRVEAGQRISMHGTGQRQVRSGAGGPPAYARLKPWLRSTFATCSV